ncbi:hypothetical protein [Coleofasciculus sp. G2-EDA-02]
MNDTQKKSHDNQRAIAKPEYTNSTLLNAGGQCPPYDMWGTQIDTEK